MKNHKICQGGDKKKRVNKTEAELGRWGSSGIVAEPCAVFNIVQEGFTIRRCLSREPNDAKKQLYMSLKRSGGKKWNRSSKALRLRCVWHTQGAERRPLRLEWCSRGRVEADEAREIDTERLYIRPERILVEEVVLSEAYVKDRVHVIRNKGLQQWACAWWSSPSSTPIPMQYIQGTSHNSCT